MSLPKPEPEPERTYKIKTRLCLKCRKPFESGWEGERICRHCKSKSSWREGEDFEMRDYRVR